jgi:outer membrane protein OmpA-like peptidoglycan-associated protein
VVNLGDAINSGYAERMPLISLDGKALYFARKAHPQNMGEENKDDIWVSYFDEKNDTWSKAVNVGSPLNNDGHNFVVSINTSADAMYLANDYNSIVKDAISYTTRNGRKWAQPRRLDIPDYKNKSPFVNYHVSKDEKYLLVAAEQNKSEGGRDFYVSFKTSKGWSALLNLGPDINTEDEENSIFLAADNKTVYFSSNGRQGLGGYDLYMSRRLDDSWTNWSTPKNLGKVINTPQDDLSISIPASGEYVYLARGPLKNTDIYKVKLPVALKPQPVTFIQAQLVDAKTQKPVNGEIYFEAFGKKSKDKKIRSREKLSSYIAQQDEDMSIYAQVPGYFPASDSYITNEDRYEAVDGDNPVYYENSEVQVLQNKLDDLQRELKKLSEKKSYQKGNNKKNKNKKLNTNNKKASRKAGVFSDVNENDKKELDSLKEKYAQHFEEEDTPLRKEVVEAKESDSDALKATRKKYEEYYGGGDSATAGEKKNDPSSLEKKSFCRNVEKALYGDYYLSIIRIVKKEEEVQLSAKDIANLEERVKADLSQYWIARLLEELEIEHQNKLKKDVKEQMRRNLKEEFASVLSTELSIIIKVQKEKNIEASINKQLAEKPKKKTNFQKENSTIMESSTFKKIEKELALVPISKGAILPLNNIFFDINEATLKPQSSMELERILTFIKSNPQLELEIGGHTNGWCSPEFAVELSTERAEAVYDYLVGKGVKESKLTFKGYGKKDPIASNATATGRKKNQRVELKITEIIE